MASGGTKASQEHSITAAAPPYLKIAKADLGKNERRDRKYFNERIHDKLGLDYDVRDTPWCAMFIGICLEEAGYTSTKKANARSYLKWGEAVDDWREGDIVVFWRGAKDDGVTGHIGFLLKWDDDTVTVLGGNQGDEVSIQKFSRRKILKDGVRRYRSILSSRTIRTAAVKVAIGAEEVVRNAAPSADTAEQTRSLFDQVMTFWPTTGQWVGFVIIALGAYIIYRKYKDSKNV